MGIPLTSELQRLDDFLCSEAVDYDAMLLSELDGFLVGVIVMPELVTPGEWLPLVWGEEAPVFADEAEAQTVLDLIMLRYNDLIRQLNEDCYAPLYDYDIDDSVLWHLWIEGFWKAILLRPESWQTLPPDREEEAGSALFVLGRLFQLASDFPDLEPLEIDEELEEQAAVLIPALAGALYRTRLSRDVWSMGAQREGRQKVGRNDPCPCGSGKKHKKCCLGRTLEQGQFGPIEAQPDFTAKA